MTYDFRARSDAAMIFNNEPSMTKQDFASQCDVNNILKKYTKHGVNPFVITADAKYGDFSSLPSYQEALDFVVKADEYFDSLPAKVRARFANNPAELLKFVSDESNREEAISLGLIEKKSDLEKKSPALPVVDLQPKAEEPR